jgi:hypothetical protein
MYLIGTTDDLELKGINESAIFKKVDFNFVDKPHSG